MAGQSITFDFLSRGAATVAGDFRKTGDNAALAARGAKILGEAIEKLGAKEGRTAEESKILAAALRETGKAEDRVTARAVLADAAVRRLDDAMKAAAKKREAELKVKVDDSELGKLKKALGGLTGPGLLGPAVALAPAAGVLAGVAGGAGIGLAGAFVAGGLALAAFGAVAKPVLTDAKKAAGAVEKAQNAYNVAIANGVPPAKAFKAEQLAIAKAYAGMSPAQIALSKQLGGMASAWDKVKAAQTPVVAGALQPWLKSVTGLTQNLAPIIAKIAPVIASLGGQFNSLVNSSAFRGFRDFIGSTGSAAVSAGGSTIIDLVKSFMILLPKFDPLIREAVGWISRLGPAVLTWASSKKASDDITKFMQWFSRNGPVVGGLLRNIGGALAALAPGLTSGGALELKIISDFLGFVAKLPPAVAKPLAEVAGAALILSKMGGGKVISFLVTAAFGGLLKGGGSGAGGAAAGAAGAGGIWSKLTPGARLVGGALAVTLVVDAVLKGTKSGPGGKNWFDNPFGMPGPKDKASASNWLTSWSPYVNFFTKTIPGLFAGMARDAGIGFGRVGASADALRTKNLAPLLGETGKVSGGIQGLSGIIQGTLLNALRAAGTHSDDLRTRNLVPLRGEAGKVSGGIQGLARYLNPGLSGAADTGGAHVNSFRTNNLGPLQGSLSKTSGGVQGLQGLINAMHGKTVNVGVHGSGSGGVSVTPSTGVPGAKNYSVFFKPLAAGGLVSYGSGPTADDVFARLSKGELVVPARMVQAGAVDHLRGRLPGFAGGGLAGAQDAIGAGGAADAAAEVRVDISAMVAAIKKAAAAAVQAAPGVSGAGPVGGDAAANKALARQMFPWNIYTQWGAFDTLEMHEAGYNRFARNPSSGAYGIPQAYPPTKMPFAAQAAGGSHAGPQLAWMFNYIRQVYGTPAAAWAQYYNHPGGQGSYAKGGLVPGYASGGTVSKQGAAYLRAWQTRHGGGFGAAWGPATVNAQIDAANRVLGRDTTLAGASLPASQHKHYVAAAAWWRRHRDALVHERGVMRDWRGQLGGSDAAITRWIRAAGTSKALAPSVKRWKHQRAFQEKEIAAVSGMLGWSAAQQAAIARAHPPGKPGKPGTPAGPPLPAITHTTGAVTDVIEAFLASHAAPFGAARGALVMDSGGWLKPGWNAAYNGTGRPEQLLPARGGGGGGTIRLEVAPGGGSEFDRFMVAWLRKHVHVKGGGNVQAAFGTH